jgi:ABC-type transport system involved in multi-copper enzyme maturation permease subunit
MLWRVLSNEQSKVFKRAVLWVSVALLAALLVIQTISNYGTAVSAPSTRANSVLAPERLAQLRQAAIQASTWPSAPLHALSQIEQMGWFVAIVVAGAVVAQEYTWRTLHQSLSHGVARETWVVGKFASLLLPTVLVVLIPLAVVTPLTLVFSTQITGGFSLAQVSLVQIGLGVLRTTYGLLPYVALTLFLSTISRSVVAPIGGGLAYAFVELLLSLSGVAWARFLPRGLVISLGAAGGAAQPGVALVEPVVAGTILALYTILFVGLSVLTLRRQDLAG